MTPTVSENIIVTHDLVAAAKVGNLQEVYNALVAGQSIHQTNVEGRTALHEAVLNSKNKPVAIEYLLKVGSDIEARDRLGRSALHMACVVGNYDVVALLLAKGADINAKDNNGNQPVHFAAGESSSKMLGLLLNHGAGAEEKNSRGDTPLHCAAKNAKIENANFLIGHGVNINPVNRALNTPLHEASNSGNKEAVELLLASGANEKARNERGETALHLAICSNVMLALISRNPGLVHFKSRNGNTPLHSAASKHNESCINLLLEVGRAEPDAKNNLGLKPIDFASTANVFNKLLDNDAEKPSGGPARAA